MRPPQNSDSSQEIDLGHTFTNVISFVLKELHFKKRFLTVFTGATSRQNHAHFSNAAATGPNKIKSMVLDINAATHVLNTMMLLLRQLQCCLAGEIMCNGA